MILSYYECLRHTVHARHSLIQELPIGKVVDVVIDPENGKIPLIWIATSKGLKILSSQLIIKWNRNEIWVSDEHDLKTTDELPKMEALFDREIDLMKHPVKTLKSQVYLGRIQNFYIDSVNPRLLSIVVRKWWPWANELVIPRAMVAQMEPDFIYVQDLIMNLKAGKRALEK